MLESRKSATKKPSGNAIANVRKKISSVIFEPVNMDSTVSSSLSINYLPLFYQFKAFIFFRGIPYIMREHHNIEV
jgi:hypothetical protein